MKDPKKNGSGLDVARLSIRSAPVFVGDCQLTLREPGYCSLIEITEMILSESLAENAKKLTGLAKGAFDDTEQSKGSVISRYLGAIVDVLREGILPLIGRQLREVAVILLDTQKNRDAVAKHLQSMGDERTADEIFPVEWDDDDVDHCPSFRSWVRRSITVTQFDYVMEAFQGMRGWVDLGKRIAGRFGLGSLMVSLQDEISPTGSPETPN